MYCASLLWPLPRVKYAACSTTATRVDSKRSRRESDSAAPTVERDQRTVPLEVSSPWLNAFAPLEHAGVIGETGTISSQLTAAPARAPADAGEHACVVDIDGEREETRMSR